MPNVKFKFTGDDSELRKKLAGLAKLQADINFGFGKRLTNMGSNAVSEAVKQVGQEAIKSGKDLEILNRIANSNSLRDSKLADMEAMRKARLAIQEEILEQKKLRSAVEQGKITQQEYRSELAKITVEEKKRSIALRDIKKQLSETSEYGKLNKALGELRKQSKDVLAEMFRMERQGHANTIGYEALRKKSEGLVSQTLILDKGIKKIDATLGLHQRNVGNYGEALELISPQIASINQKLQIFGTSLDDLSGKPGAIRELGASFVTMGKGILAFLLSPVGLLISTLGALFLLFKSNRQTVIDFNSGLRNVSKTTELTGKDLRSFGSAIVDLSMKLKVVDATKLLEYATAAGQLGVRGRADILAFTEALAMLETASDIKGEEGASRIARTLTLIDGGVQNVKAFGDEIVNLGNNFAATESEILSNAESISQNVGIYKIGRQQVLAFATATKAVGLEAELVGSTFSRTLGEFEKSLRSGKGVSDLLKVIGGTSQDLSRRFREDAAGVFVDYVKGLNNIYKTGGSVNEALERTGIIAVRDQRVIASLASNGYDVLSDALLKVSDANGAMQQEFENGAGKLENQTKRMGIAWDNFVLSIEDGEGSIGRAVVSIVGFFATLTNEITRLSKSESFGEFARRFTEIGASGDGALKTVEDFKKSYSEIKSVTQSVRLGKIDFEILSDKDLKIQLERFTELKKQAIETSSEYQAAILSKRLSEQGSWFKSSAGNLSLFKSQEEEAKAAYERINKIAKNRGIELNPITSKVSFEEESEKEKLKREKAEAAAAKKAERAMENRRQAVERQRALQLSIDQTNEQVLRNQISRDDQEVASIKDKYAKIREEVRKFYDDPKNKGKKVDTSGLLASEKFEVNEAETRFGTKTLIEDLSIKKSLLDEYNAYAEKTSIEEADKRYRNELNLIKGYKDSLRKEYLDIIAMQTTAENTAFSGTAVKLTQAQEERAKVLKELIASFDKEERGKENAKYAEAYNAAKTHTQKLEDIEKEYQQNIKALGEKVSAEELANLKKLRDEKVKGENEEFFLKSELYKKAAKEALIRARQEIKDQIKAVEELLKTDLAPNIKDRLQKELQGLKINLSIGSVKTNIANLEKQRQDISNAMSQFNIDNKISEVTDEVLDTYEPLKKLYDQLHEITDQINKLKKEANDGGGIFGFLKKLEGNKALQEVSDWGNVAAQSFSEMSQALGGSETQAGYLLGTIGELAGAAADVAGAIASGDPKAIVKSVVGAVGSIISISRRTKEMNRQAREENKKFYDEAMKGERDYQALLRQRERESASRGKNSYNAIIAQLEAIKKQSPELQKAYDKIFSSLQGQDFIDGKGYQHGTWFRKAKTWDVMASLGGSDYNELEKLYSQGKLKDKAKEDFEALKALKEELEEAGLSVDDLQKSLNELLTGTSVSGLASGLADLFANGKRSAQDFGDSFESIMQNAIKSSFQAKFMEDAMQPFYEELAVMMEGGNLTGDQIQKLKDKYINLGEEYAKKWEDIEKVTGVDLSNKDKGSTGSLKNDIQAVTESTAGRLEAEFGGFRIAQLQTLAEVRSHGLTLSKQLEIANSNLVILNAIQVNTYRTAGNTDRLESIENALVSINNKVSSSDAARRGAGL